VVTARLSFAVGLDALDIIMKFIVNDRMIQELCPRLYVQSVFVVFVVARRHWRHILPVCGGQTTVSYNEGREQYENVIAFCKDMIGPRQSVSIVHDRTTVCSGQRWVYSQYNEDST
jgi:hypothetical protein